MAVHSVPQRLSARHASAILRCPVAHVYVQLATTPLEQLVFCAANPCQDAHHAMVPRLVTLVILQQTSYLMERHAPASLDST